MRRPHVRRARIAVLLSLAFLAFAAASAQAAPVPSPLPRLSHEGYGFPCGAATDSRGNLYVADALEEKVYLYDQGAEGGPTQIAEFETSANAELPCGLAVDPSGNVYVDGWETDVVKYSPSEYPPTPSTTYQADTSINGTGTLVPASSKATAVAVDPETSNVYVVEEESHVSEYSPAGAKLKGAIGQGLISGAAYYGVDVYGETGNVYLTDKAHNKAYVLNPDGSSIEAEIDGSEAPQGAFTAMAQPTLAVDQGTGNVLVSDIAGHGVVDEFTEAGVFLTEISHEPPLSEEIVPNDIAVDGGSASHNKGTVYVASGEGHVYAFGPLPGGKPTFPLTVKKAGAGNATITSSPIGIDCGSTCEVEFDEGKEVLLTAVAAIGSKLAGWSGCEEVLGPDEEQCKVRIEGSTEVTLTVFSRPLVSEEAASQVTASSARLEAKVNPKGKATSYRFEYITEAAYEANGESFSGPQPASKAPASAVAIGSGISPVAVGVKLSGLAPFTHYRFRVVATNEIGTAEGERDGADEEIPHGFTTYAPSQSFSGECPANEALRSGPSAELPDCRAYEQASPVNKNGGGIMGKAPITRASEAGDAISFESPAGVPGGEGAQEFPSYVGLRNSSAWTTKGLLPNALTGQSADWLGWTPDFAEAIDEVAKFGVGTALIARSPATGAEQAIAPYTQDMEYAYLGSSEDRSTVLFEARDTTNTNLKLIPDAAPGKPNVYAWDREEPGTVRLAGVLPDGSTPPQGTGAGASALEYVRDTHRVAADGSVFFTDLETGKLYLRLNPAAEETTDFDPDGNCEPDPALACTIAASASRKENGGGLDGHDAAGSQPATFMAASADGGSALFLSSEKLTDDATTGPEPTAPAIARADKSDGSGKDLGFLPTFAHEIAIDQATEYVYWTDPDHGRIGRSKLDKSDFTESYVSGLDEPQGIAVVDQGASKFIFWTERGALNEEGKAQTGLGSIGRADLDGNNVNQSCVTGITNPRSIAADAGFIYWTMPIIGEGPPGTTGRAQLSCAGVNTNLIKGATNTSGDIAVDASHIYVSVNASTFNNSFIYRFGIDGSGSAFSGNFPINLPGTDGAVSLSLDDSHLYFANRGTSEIGRADLDGANADLDFITEASHPEDLALDAAHLYWPVNQKLIPNKGTDLYRYDSAGGVLEDLAVDHGDPNGAEVQGVVGTSKDASVVYFVANGIPDGIGNSPNEQGESAAPGSCKGGGNNAEGTCNLYVYHDGSVDFIARLDANGSGKNSNPINSEGGSTDAYNWARGRAEIGKVEDDKSARVSDDGRVLVFRSVRALTGYDNGGPICGSDPGSAARIPGRCTEFYRFTYDDKGLACISCDPRGEAATGPARIASIRPGGLGAVPHTAVLSRNLSSDGERFFFETTDALLSRDTNGEGGCPPWGPATQALTALACQDVYEWEAPDKGSCKESSPAFSQTSGGCVYLISSGKSPEASFFADASLDGDNAFLYTYAQLVPADQDALLDVYDARIDGGMSAQHQAATVPCEGKACKGSTSQVPAKGSPGTSSFQGPGNQSTGPKPRTRCPKGKRRVRRQGKARCVKRRHKQSNRRAAKTSGRAGR
jgi:virginiamycin B lyase